MQHTLHRHDPGLDGGERPAEVLLTRAVARQAALIAQGMLVGFVQPPAEVLARMQAANPALLPRNHQVERALAQAVEQGDLGAVERLLSALAAPYAPRPEHDEYRLPAAPDERVLATFCGT